ncbi:Biotin--protein ligase [Cyberlindnera fabianii]|uniref:Biotin--protein ligase n=1 Tax=Cyberlindnera fabianii TaxID=36022 RepID=A0A1V2LA29_CYBFA|nr:Biotin--protein ligase [Cyberlindnera fabianii]
MNVLVYSGPGTTPDSVKHCLESLRRFLSPFYAVVGVDANTLKNEPWPSKTALVVIPGGADVPVCRELNGRGNQVIRDFVRKGGRLMGFCSGAYYSSAYCEFEVGDPLMEVSGTRELKLFPGISRGCAYKGFKYGDEAGSRLSELTVNKEFLGLDIDRSFHYYNGGGVFVDADTYDNVTVLAEYVDKVEVEAGNVQAAAVHCTLGSGAAILTGTHPEFLPELMAGQHSDDKNYAEIVKGLSEHNEERRLFLRACLQKLGLKVNDSEVVRPRLTPILLTSPVPGVVDHIVEGMINDIGLSGEENNLLRATNDTFRLHPIGESLSFDTQLSKQEEFEDPDTAIKELYVCGDTIPDRKLTSYFDIKKYFRFLQENYGSLDTVRAGSVLFYGEVVTSTNTLADKNFAVLKNLPSGTVLAASVQVSGRGRSGNVWINPYGVCASSLILDLPVTYTHAPVVFIQYLTALAVVEAVKSMGAGYEDLPIKIKWPNDIYAMKEDYFGRQLDVNDTEPAYVKVSGILVNTNVMNGKYKCIVGTGINLFNKAPTTSINSTIASWNNIRAENGLEKLEPISEEQMLAKYMYYMGEFFEKFKQFGFKALLPTYYKHWLHTGQIVRLQDHGLVRAKITGITDDFGLLVAEEVNMTSGKLTGKKYHLQPDGNSFDMFNGLISKKVN